MPTPTGKRLQAENYQHQRSFERIQTVMQIIADIKVQHRAELNERLDTAIAAAHAEASTNCRGVLVTRHDFDHYTVALSPTIPFGVIHEVDQARRK